MIRRITCLFETFITDPVKHAEGLYSGDMEKRRVEDLQIAKLAAMTLDSAFNGEIELTEDAVLAVKEELYNCTFNHEQIVKNS